MTRYEAPAKLNLALLVRPPEAGGYHPIESLVQTVEWCDILEVEPSEEDRMEVDGSDLDPEDNLVTRALSAARGRGKVPPLRITLHKAIPDRAGLGGGSADAAAMLRAAGDLGRLPPGTIDDLAPTLGSDVPLFRVGGTLLVGGLGETFEPLPALAGLAMAIAVPERGLDTAEVYRRWDEMEGPQGEAVPARLLPPPLRDGIPIRNDLTPAAMDIWPEMADFMADLRSGWGAPVMMTGSGTACFGLFPSVDEAAGAATAVTWPVRAALGVAMRERGVGRVVESLGSAGETAE